MLIYRTIRAQEKITSYSEVRKGTFEVHTQTDMITLKRKHILKDMGDLNSLRTKLKHSNISEIFVSIYLNATHDKELS